MARSLSTNRIQRRLPTGLTIEHVVETQEVVLVGEPGTELSAKVRLGRIGFDNIAGYLVDAAGAFLQRQDVIVRSSPPHRRRPLPADGGRRGSGLVDVRNPGEVALGVIDGARTIPVPRLRAEHPALDPALPTVVSCAGGYRSSIASSLLTSFGFADVSDLVGGYGAWATAARLRVR